MYDAASTEPLKNKPLLPEISPVTSNLPLPEISPNTNSPLFIELLLPLLDTNRTSFLYISPVKFIEPDISNA